MKDRKVVLKALLCFILFVSLILPGAVAGASSANAQPPEGGATTHSVVGSFSYSDCLRTELPENCAMIAGRADSRWPELRQNLQVTDRRPNTGREISDEPDQAATTTANDGDQRTEGFWLDYITIQREPDWTTAVLKLQACEYEVYANTVDDEALFDIVNSDPALWYKSSIYWFNTLRINPYGPEFDTGMVNPFHLFEFPEGVRTMQEVLHKFIDRDFIVNDIMNGLAWPRYTSQHTQLSDYARYYDGTYIDPAKSISALEDEYRYDPVTGRAWLNTTMAAINDLAPGTITGNADNGWLYNGDSIPMIIAIRSDHPIREQIGDYVVAKLRDMGFDAIPFKGDMAATLSDLANVDAEIRGGGWTIYTGGWVTTVLARDSGYWFIHFHTNLWSGGIPAFQYLDVPQEFWDAAFDLSWLNFTSFDERDALYEICLPEHMKFGMFYLVDTRGFSPLKKSVNLAADRAGGIFGSWMWALTAHFRDIAGNPQFGGHMMVAMHDLLVEPWNPIAGSNTVYDMMPIRATGDMGTHPDTRDGLRWAGRIDSAEVILQTGLPAIATNPWVELSFEDTITAPGDAWRDWDPETQTPRTVQDALNSPEEPWGLETAEVKRYSVAYYPADIWDHPLHCGSTLSYADFLYSWILTYDRGQEGSAIYDPVTEGGLSFTRNGIIGVRFSVNPSPEVGLKVETWSERWEMDAERTVSDWYPNYSQGNGFWHTIALGILGERAGEVAFGEVKAQPTTLGWINFVNRDVQQYAFVGYLEGIRALDPGDYSDASVPYYEFISGQYSAASLGSFAAEVDLRMYNLEDFVGRVDHLWVGSGPYYVDDYSLAHKWVRLAAFEDYPDPADRWLFLLLDEQELRVSSTDGGRVTAPGEGTFTYPEGAVVDLIAEPDDHYRFAEWTGDVQEIDEPLSATTFITMWGDYEITAVFLHDPPLLVTRTLPQAVTQGEAFEVTVTFTSPADAFNAIGMGDVAPADWTVGVDTAWCNPPANAANPAIPWMTDLAEYLWFGPYDEGVSFTAVYRVQVPADAAFDTYTFPGGTLEYYLGTEGPLVAAISGDSEVEVVAARIEGQTREVNCDILPGVTVTLYLDNDLIASTVSDEDGYYTLPVPGSGECTVVASKEGFRNREQSIQVDELTTYTVDFVADHGLIPNEPDMSYVLACINLWQFGEPPCKLTMSTVLAVINAWQFPVEEQAVHFPDPNLEAAIREAIGKPTGDIHPADLEGLTVLSANERSIADLSGLEYCTNLTYLYLVRNELSDLSPIAALADLRELWLEGNQIDDVSPIAKLTALESLVLALNSIEDLSPLVDLTALESLSLGENQISDISPLGSLTSLRSLGLRRNQIADISALSTLTALDSLYVMENQIGDISPLQGLTNLAWLVLSNNEISDISPLAGLTSLTGLFLESNQIMDIHPLVENEGLGEGDAINLRWNPLSEESINDHIPELTVRGVTVYY